MVSGNSVSGGLEWRIRSSDGSSSEILVTESGLMRKIWLGIIGLIFGFIGRVQGFFRKAWEVAVDDTRKVMHCVKVGVALTVVSLFYYMRPLYNGVGGNAMWAVLTVVVVFEFTVGATLSKSINRAMGTCLAGALAVGVHFVANRAGETFEPIILRTSVFLLATAATFSRFIPTVKARFDYGAMIFILTFSLVTVSGYRVDDLFFLAQDRLATVMIGGAMCLIVTMLICPVWAGQDLHVLVARNMEKLADSLDGCVAECFRGDTDTEEIDEASRKKMLGYKCVLNSKATEEALANFARWEPAHGRFSFRHPWTQYLKVGATVRSCAYCIEALSGCINSEIQAPEFLRNHLRNICMELCTHSSTVLKELANITKSMRKSGSILFSIEEMKTAAEELQKALKSVPTPFIQSEIELMDLTEEKKAEQQIVNPAVIPLIEVLPVVTATSLLIEITKRVEQIVVGVDELAKQANFKPVKDRKKNKKRSDVGQDPMKAFEMV